MPRHQNQVCFQNEARRQKDTNSYGGVIGSSLLCMSVVGSPSRKVVDRAQFGCCEQMLRFNSRLGRRSNPESGMPADRYAESVLGHWT